MKIRLLNIGLLACAILMMLSGCSSDNTLTGDSATPVKSMKINVSDGMFTAVDNGGAKTRAIDNGNTTSGITTIGIFAVKPDGTLALTNAKYSYTTTRDGVTAWFSSDGKDYLPYYDGIKYFAYYPYQANLSSDKYDTTQTTAETFFASLISGWTPAADQSTQDKYTAQDLMVSMATVDVPTHNCTFSMYHQMAMVEMDLHQAYYTYNGVNTYRFTFDAPNQPFVQSPPSGDISRMVGGKYRLLVKPSKPFSITGKNQYNSTDATKTKGWRITETAPVAAKYKIYKYNGASAWLTQTSRQNVYISDVNLGEYLYDDGTIGTATSGKTIVGIIFSDELSQAEYNAGYTHGHALALNNASGAGPTWGPCPSDAGLTKVNSYPSYYNDINAGYYGTFTKGYNKSNSSYPAWQAANNYNVDVSRFKNSGWYLPSAGQWWDVCANLNWGNNLSRQQTGSYSALIMGSRVLTDEINNAIIIAGGTALNIPEPTVPWSAWCASEHDTGNAVIISFYFTQISLNYCPKNITNAYVRSVLTF